MNLVKVKCAFCEKEFFRERGRFNEAKKFGWNQYCSLECQSKAKTKRVIKVCGNPDCKKIVFRRLNEFKKSKSGFIFCSRSCAAIVNNKKFPKKKAKIEICAVCGKIFRKRGKSKYCSLKCKREAQGCTPEKILDIIKSTAQRLGRVPAKRELMKIEKACRKFFGSWNNAVIAAGFKPNRSHDHRMYKRIATKAIDGHLCDSISEVLIDNWLTENNIPHERNVAYPETNHKADWSISLRGKKVFIEYFGLANDSPRYDRTIKEKREICKKHQIKLIEIYPWDLYPKRQFEKKIKAGLETLSVSQGGEICTPDLRFPEPAS